MPLILRLDIDKPYGRASLKDKLCSKAAEDIYEFKMRGLGYLSHLDPFFDLLERYNVRSYVYFRNCSSPTQALQQRLEKRGDVIGFHAENTRSEDSFLNELRHFSKLVGKDVKHFSKHGSGEYKLGKNHYPIYEEEKYKEWASRNNLKFLFGNGMVKESSSFVKSSFYQDMFWVEPHYRRTDVFDLNWLAQKSKNSFIPIITHPENITADTATGASFRAILEKLSGEFLAPAEFEKEIL